jgi:1-acyl-sn-glycerol-3-phosphate acyltransferase
MLWYRFTNCFVKVTGAIPQLFVLRMKVFFEDKQKQDTRIKGSAIVFSNHRSVLDAGIMLFVFWRRTLRCLAAELMYKKPQPLPLLIKSMGMIKVDRYSHDFSFVEKSCRVLEDGGVIEIYPEARIPEDNEPTPLPFKSSISYIALRSGAPLIPVYLHGKFLKEPIRVMVGAPIQARDLYDDSLSEAENLEKITNALRQKIIDLGQELQKQIDHEKK